MIRRSPAIGALMLGLLCFAGPQPAAAQGAAAAFVANLGQQGIQVLGPSVPERQRIARFRQLFQSDFDVPGIGRFVLGRYWRIATPQQQQEFLRLFEEYVAQAYAVQLGQYGGEPFRVTAVRPAGGETIVVSEVTRPNAAPIVLDWYLINEGGQYKITDVTIGGISMKVTQRDEFASVIQRNGGISGLLAELRQKVAAG
jgi:phospholipid transport system substrate-binding protein